MAITFPRDMPANPPEQTMFELNRVDFISPEAKGRQGAMQAGETLWSGQWTLGTLQPRSADEWRAFISTLRGPRRLFYGRDYTRCVPLKHPDFAALLRAAGGAFDGSATTWDVNAEGDVVELTGLPAGFTLSIGDYVGFRWTTDGEQRRDLARCVEAATSDVSGVLEVTVEKPLASVATAATGVTAYINHPTCLMRAVPSGTNISAMDHRRAIGATLTGIQELLP